MENGYSDPTYADRIQLLISAKYSHQNWLPQQSRYAYKEDGALWPGSRRGDCLLFVAWTDGWRRKIDSSWRGFVQD